MGYPRWDPGRAAGRSRLEALARLVRIEHTIFSLPFAYAGAVLSGYSFTLWDAVLMAGAVIGLRLAAMSYNNIADLDIDRLNPRTRMRPLVTGAVQLWEAWLLVAVGAAIYFASAALLNVYALLLSPAVLAVAVTYPHSKRIHPLPHLHLGLSLGAVVFGGAVAASGDEASSLSQVLASVPWIYVAAVTFWVAGFDIIYSVMDEEFDRRHRLGSLPALLGARRAMAIALASHIVSAVLLVWGAAAYGLGPIGAVSTAGSILLLMAQHPVAWRGRVDLAFNMNLAMPMLLAAGIVVDRLVYIDI